jgi:hypothetical protein
LRNNSSVQWLGRLETGACRCKSYVGLPLRCILVFFFFFFLIFSISFQGNVFLFLILIGELYVMNKNVSCYGRRLSPVRTLVYDN